MGIINVTPDSFYAGSRHTTTDIILKKAEEMINDGADFIDIGGYSTRPGAEIVSIEEELKRVIPSIQAIKKSFPDITISIDTFRAKVATEAVCHGASIVNDVSGGNLDKDMYQTIASLKVPYVLMHMRGTPENMKDHAQYDNVVLQVIKELSEKLRKLYSIGIADVIIDPGFGFAKNIGHNFEMLKNLAHFSSFELPLLIGISRKSMIYKSLGVDPPEALNGTSALHMIALQNGANILRVHDVKEARQVVKLYTLTYS